MQPGELIASDQGARPAQPTDLAAAWATLAQVMDPEVPVVSVVDLGIVRDLDWQAGHLHVVVTPTYSGCPATEVIEGDIRDALELAGFRAPQLERKLTPAWTTDWITMRQLSHRSAQRIRLHRLQGAAPLPRLPRTVRLFQVHLRGRRPAWLENNNEQIP
jgi:phenylacetate-CoA oxygenase PaaJ subunit